MKKIIFLFLSLCICFTACQKDQEKDEVIEDTIDTNSNQVIVMMPNPIIELEKPEDFNEMNIFITAPSDASSVMYSKIEEIAQAIFIIDEIEYNLRASYMDEDFSGIYSEFSEESQETILVNDDEVVVVDIKANGDSVDGIIAYWQIADCKMNLYADENLDKEDFLIVINEIINLSYEYYK